MQTQGWADGAREALAPLPAGPVRDALAALAESVVTPRRLTGPSGAERQRACRRWHRCSTTSCARARAVADRVDAEQHQGHPDQAEPDPARPGHVLARAAGRRRAAAAPG